MYLYLPLVYDTSSIYIDEVSKPLKTLIDDFDLYILVLDDFALCFCLQRFEFRLNLLSGASCSYNDDMIYNFLFQQCLRNMFLILICTTAVIYLLSSMNFYPGILHISYPVIFRINMLLYWVHILSDIHIVFVHHS